MKFIQVLCFLFISLNSFSQPKIEFSAAKIEDGVALFANNNEFCPVSAEIIFSLTNMSASTGKQTVFVIPAKAKNFLITELKKNEANGGYKYSYKFKSNYGDITIEEYDTTYEYDLPFSKGSSYSLDQGYNGSFSHQNENALDFTMPEGSNVAAARDGIVVSVIQNNTATCPNKSCIQFNNYVNIYHSDGTFASYSHIKYNGSKVKIGDIAKQGDIIALSGNTGFTSGPHLHFVCFLPGLEERRTIETYFKINEGDEVIKIKEKETYFKNY